MKILYQSLLSFFLISASIQAQESPLQADYFVVPLPTAKESSAQARALHESLKDATVSTILKNRLEHWFKPYAQVGAARLFPFEIEIREQPLAQHWGGHLEINDHYTANGATRFRVVIDASLSPSRLTSLIAHELFHGLQRLAHSNPEIIPYYVLEGTALLFEERIRGSFQTEISIPTLIEAPLAIERGVVQREDKPIADTQSYFFMRYLYQHVWLNELSEKINRPDPQALAMDAYFKKILQEPLYWEVRLADLHLEWVHQLVRLNHNQWKQWSESEQRRLDPARRNEQLQQAIGIQAHPVKQVRLFHPGEKLLLEERVQGASLLFLSRPNRPRVLTEKLANPLSLPLLFEEQNLPADRAIGIVVY